MATTTTLYSDENWRRNREEMKQNGHKYNAEMDVYVLLKKKKKELKKRKQRTEQRREEKTHEKKNHTKHTAGRYHKNIFSVSRMQTLYFFFLLKERTMISTLVLRVNRIIYSNSRTYGWMVETSCRLHFGLWANWEWMYECMSARHRHNIRQEDVFFRVAQNEQALE